MGLSCDLFCAVVDNLGDAGVCWRLSRQLAAEHGWTMRLWIDDLAPLAALRPGLDPGRSRQEVDGVDVRHWGEASVAPSPGDVVIEAFACTLPDPFVRAMANRTPHPVWINLEYLSAEDWVTGCHGLASPHPQLPLTKHFFFPGFVPGTGGLIREGGLPAPIPPVAQAELAVSLFCYENPGLPGLLTAWTAGPQPVLCRLADGLPRRQVERWLGRPLPVGDETQLGRLHLAAIPFVPQQDYDAVLATCDLNFVRGEDSFVRAQWAERPFAWHIYPQSDDAHHSKLEAFLGRYGRGLETSTCEALCAFWRAWNGAGDVAAAWPAFRAALPALQAHAATWAADIARAGNLAGNLVRFCEARI